MDQVILPQRFFGNRKKRYRRLIRREVEMLDIFRQLPDADQERVLLVIRGIARTTGPLFPRH
ncbi:hypothetical protein QE444_002816 [Pseudomonas sp. SORGH_AS199]|nr:hypothetical protein [Pseudomonas sp. SORGH_AS_0199]